MVRSYRVDPESMVLEPESMVEEPESMVVTAFYFNPQSPGFGFVDWGLGLDNIFDNP